MMNIVEASDYLDALAERLGANSEMRRKWRERGKIATTWHARLFFAAGKDAERLPKGAFDRFTPTARRKAA